MRIRYRIGHPIHKTVLCEDCPNVGSKNQSESVVGCKGHPILIAEQRCPVAEVVCTQPSKCANVTRCEHGCVGFLAQERR